MIRIHGQLCATTQASPTAVVFYSRLQKGTVKIVPCLLCNYFGILYAVLCHFAHLRTFIVCVIYCRSMVAYIKCEISFGEISTDILSLISMALFMVLWSMSLFKYILFSLQFLLIWQSTSCVNEFSLVKCVCVCVSKMRGI